MHMRRFTFFFLGMVMRACVQMCMCTADEPHTIVLQHTQDYKAKTRRMLWVDGSEKVQYSSRICLIMRVFAKCILYVLILHTAVCDVRNTGGM